MSTVENIAIYITNKLLTKEDYIFNMELSTLIVLSKYVHYYKFEEMLFKEDIVYRKFGPRIEYIHSMFPSIIMEPLEGYNELELENIQIKLNFIPFVESNFTEKERYTLDSIIENHSNKRYKELQDVILLYEKALGSRLQNLNVKCKLPSFP